MAHDESPRDLDPFARDLIRRKARQLARRAGLSPEDHEDVQQELAAQLLHRLRAFDPSRSPRDAFLRMVIARCAANLLRDRRARRRDRSLYARVRVEGEGSEELAQFIGAHEHAAHHGHHPRRPEELAQLLSDVAAVLADLPADLRDLAERLQHQTVSQIARDLGMPRTTLYGRVRRLRRRFERVGLKDYL